MKTPKIISIEVDNEGRYEVRVGGSINSRFSPDNAGFNAALVYTIKHAFSLRFDYGNPNVKIVFKGIAAQHFCPESLVVEELSIGIEELEPVS